jgi:sugar lactone lactonase YvrE
MAFGSTGDLLIADGANLLKINRFGLTTRVLSGFTRALDLQSDRFGNLLVADDIEGKVYCVTLGLERKVLIDRHLTPMWFSLGSIALDSTKQNAYLAEMVTGRIIKVPLPASGVAGEPEVIAQGIVGLRFLAVDDEDNVYANTHFPILIRIDKGKKQRRFFMDNLEDPAGMAFGRKGFDRGSLYITNRYGITRVSVPKGEAR